MAARKRRAGRGSANGAGTEASERRGSLGFEADLWKTADLLRSNMDPAEYKHVVLGLLFLKYVSDAFVERSEQLADAVREPQSEYYVGDPKKREKELAHLREDPDEFTGAHVFWVPKEARWETLRANARQPRIGKLIDIVSNIGIGSAEHREKDDEPFAGKLKRLVSLLREQQAEGARLEKAIVVNLKGLGLGD